MTYWAGTIVWPDETPPASLDDFIATPRKQAFWKSCKNLSTIQRSDQVLRTSWASTLVWSLVLPDETMLVSSSNFSATPRQTASRNSCENLRAIQQSDQQLRTSWAGTLVWFLVWPFQALGVSSSNFSAKPKKATSINSCINLSAIQRSDQELMTFWVGTLVWPDKTPPASLDDFIATPRKQTFWNSCKNLSTIQRSDQKLHTSLAYTLVWSLVLPK